MLGVVSAYNDNPLLIWGLAILSLLALDYIVCSILSRNRAKMGSVMELCQSGHEEVCYSGKECPACKLAQELDEARSRIQSLEEDLSATESSLEDEESKVASLEQEKSELERENSSLDDQRLELERERDSLEERIAELESE